jgi:hypothetical protein
MPGDGRGYTRPASLVSVWSTAPFLLNNAVGPFYGEPSVEARMASFHESIQQMLWPEKRQKDAVLGDKVPGYIQRTTSASSLKVAWGYLPGKFSWFRGLLGHWLPRIFDEFGLEIGPIPKGTPVSLLANLPFVAETTALEDRLHHAEKLLTLAHKLRKDLKALPPDATDAQAIAAFSGVVPDLVKLSKCPDYVVNRGHYFGSNLSDEDKWALIEFLKTF